MAISTDFTHEDLSTVLQRPAEVGRITTGSGNGSQGPAELSKKTEHSMETITAPANELPFAVTRESARKIAELTSDQEYNSLLDRHRALVKKRFTEGGLTKSEALHLQLIRWMLDSVEVARIAPDGMDTLEQLTRAQETIANQLLQTAHRLATMATTEVAKNERKSRNPFSLE
jgi:hypothetical protein